MPRKATGRTHVASPAELDGTDRKILGVLQEDGALSVEEIGKRVSLSKTPCWNRIKRLQESKIILRRVALLDAEKLGLELVVLASVKLSELGRRSLEKFERDIARFPEVTECYTIAGEEDFVLRIVTESILSYDQFLRSHLLTMPGVAGVNSRIAIKQVKYSTDLPLVLSE